MPIEAQVQRFLKENLSKEISNKTRKNQNPKMFNGLETLKEGIAPAISEDILKQ